MKTEAQSSHDTALNTKGMLFDYFIKHQPQWVGTLIYADDEKSPLKSVRLIADKTKSSIAMLEVNPEEDFKKSNSQVTKDKYRQIISNGMQRENTMASDISKENIEQYRLFVNYVKALQKKLPLKWQAYATLSEIQYAELKKTVGNTPEAKSDSTHYKKMLALFQLNQAMINCAAEMRLGIKTFEEAKIGMMEPIQKAIANSRKVGLFQSKTATGLEQFIALLYQVNESKPALRQNK